MTSATVSVWRDCGFTEGALEVPSKTSSLPASTFTYELQAIPRNTLFSRMTVKAPYEDLYDCSYLKMTLDLNNGADVTVYGWIDTVECSSDTTGSPATVISWHIDYWRTYAFKARYGAGIVQRRGNPTDFPPQPYPYRYRTVEESVKLCGDSYWWIYFMTTTSGETSALNTYCFPVDISHPSTSVTVGSGKALPLSSVSTGLMDDKFGLDPKAVAAVYLSPIAPEYPYTGALSMTHWTETFFNDPNKTDKWQVYRADATPLEHATPFYERNGSLAESVKTSDTSIYAVTDLDGDIIGTLPWGMSVKDFTYRMIVDTRSAYIQIRFNGVDSHAEGICYTIPMPALPTTENAWSSYVYSGARSADIQQMRTEADRAHETAIAGTAISGAEGALSGALLGSSGGIAGAGTGAVVGAATSMVSNYLTAESNYAISQKYNAKFQSITDYRMKHQTNGLIMLGSGFDVCDHGTDGIRLIRMDNDEYSQGVRARDIEIYGAHVSEPTASCQSLVEAGGPLQIDNLEVGGAIPTPAKDYLRRRFSQGVRMVTR